MTQQICGNPRRPARELRLPSALLLSIGFHALLLASWTSVPQLTGQSATTFTIRLQLVDSTPIDLPATAPPAKHAARQAKTSKQSESLATPKSAAMAKAAAPAIEEKIETANSAAPAYELPTGTALQSQIEALLLSDLRRHFEYPPLARQRDWQGVVWLSVTVKPDGMVEDIRVTRSSGYAVLDRSAIVSMRRVGQLAEAVHWLNGRALQLPLPVVYRLTN